MTKQDKMLCENCKCDTYTIEHIPYYDLYRIICTSCKLVKQVEMKLDVKVR